MKDPIESCERNEQDGERSVVVAETTTPEETSVLEDALHSKGIEVFVQELPDTGALPGFMLSQSQLISARRRLRVPAKDGPAAEVVIRETIRNLRREAVLHAFDPAVIEDQLGRPWEENEAEQMARLREISAEERMTVLSQRTTEWLADNVSEVKIAQWLALAGISFQEAQQLVTDLLQTRKEALRTAMERRRQTGVFCNTSGLILLGSAALMVLFAIVAGNAELLVRMPTTWTVVVGAVLVCTGMTILHTFRPEAEHDVLILTKGTPPDRHDVTGAPPA